MAKETFAFKCTSCDAMLAAKRTWVGKRVRCNKCNEVIAVPEPSGSQAQAVEPPAEAKRADDAPEHPATAAPATRDEGDVRSAGGFGSTLSRWLTEGIGGGLKNFSALFFAAVIFAVLNLEAFFLWGLPFILLTPAITGGLVLLMVNIARGRRVSAWNLFDPFVNGKYWRSVAVFWLFAAVVASALIPAAAISTIAHALATATGLLGQVVAWVITVCAALAVLYVVSRVIWAVPLVLDRGVRVTESFRQSWKMTGRIARGWGLFLLILIVRIMAAAVALVIAGISYAVFLGVTNLLTETPAAGEVGKSLMTDMLAGSLSAFSVRAALALIIFVPLCMAASAILAVPIFIGYRESIPH